jgi:SAM-dependent methyltransferase
MRDPVHHYVKEMISKYKFEEPILDCGAGWEPNLYHPLFPDMKYIKQDIICDVCNMTPIEDNSIGLVLLLESLEHIEQPQKALKEIFRILKPGGLLILTTVMAMGIHRCPKDFWRFCPDGIESLMAQFKILDYTLEGEPSFPLGIWVTGQKMPNDRNKGEFPIPRIVKAPRDDRYRFLNKFLKRFRVELRYLHKSRPRYD